jgi:hypothetical protein
MPEIGVQVQDLASRGCNSDIRLEQQLDTSQLPTVKKEKPYNKKGENAVETENCAVLLCCSSVTWRTPGLQDELHPGDST